MRSIEMSGFIAMPNCMADPFREEIYEELILNKCREQVL